MKPEQLSQYAKIWGWSKDELIEAARLLLNEASGVYISDRCYICGGEGIYMGKPCENCS